MVPANGQLIYGLGPEVIWRFYGCLSPGYMHFWLRLIVFGQWVVYYTNALWNYHKIEKDCKSYLVKLAMKRRRNSNYTLFEWITIWLIVTNVPSSKRSLSKNVSKAVVCRISIIRPVERSQNRSCVFSRSVAQNSWGEPI